MSHEHAGFRVHATDCLDDLLVFVEIVPRRDQPEARRRIASPLNSGGAALGR